MSDKSKDPGLKGLILPFLIGGTVIAGVKFAATHVNPALAAIIGGVPTGLLSIYFLTSEKAIGYSHGYFYIALVLATSILVFYMLLLHTKLDKNVVLLIALLTWAGLATLRYLYSTRSESSAK